MKHRALTWLFATLLTLASLATSRALECEGAADTSCSAFASLDITSTSGTCSGSAGASCEAVSSSQDAFEQAFNEWFAEGKDACSGEAIEAAATAVALAIAEVWTSAAAKVTCDGYGFACGWAIADGNAFALAFAEAMASAAAEAVTGDAAAGFCYADIRAVSVVLAEAASSAQESACAEDGGSEESFQASYVKAVKAAVADAFASATASACEVEGVVVADSLCQGDATSTSDEAIIYSGGDECAGTRVLLACDGPGNDMCCDGSFDKSLCSCEDCEGPWVKTSKGGDAKKVFENKKKELCFCVDTPDDSAPLDVSTETEAESSSTPDLSTEEIDENAGTDETSTTESGGESEDATEESATTTEEPATTTEEPATTTEEPATTTEEPATTTEEAATTTEEPATTIEEPATTTEEPATTTEEPATTTEEPATTTEEPATTTEEPATTTEEPATTTEEPATTVDESTEPDSTEGEEEKPAEGSSSSAPKCPGAVDTTCSAFATLDILVTGGKCSGKASASCDSVESSQNQFKEAYEEWWGEDGVCEEGKATAAAEAVAQAIAKVWADAAVQVSCEGVGFACGWTASGGQAWAIGFAEALAQAAAEATGGGADGFCYADIRAVSVVIAEAAAEAQAAACTNGGTAEDFQSNYAAAIEVGIATAFAEATAFACDAGDELTAASRCDGKATSDTFGDKFATDDACAGVSQVKACTGSGKDMCCDKSFNRNICLCTRQRCENGPWIMKSDYEPETNAKRSFEDRAKNVCFCLD